MGRRIIQQRRGKGSTTYRTNQYAYRVHLDYPFSASEGEVIDFLSLSGHSSPIAKIKTNKGVFFNVATEGLQIGQRISIGNLAEVQNGNIVPLSKIPIGTNVCNIEIVPLAGGKLVRSSGLSATVVRKTSEGV